MYTVDNLFEKINPIREKYNLPDHPFMKKFSGGEYGKNHIRWWAMKMLPGSNRFNTSFLKAMSMIHDYKDRVTLLENAYTEHGELNADEAHVNLYMRFMHAIECPEVSVDLDDGSDKIEALSFKQFKVELDEPVVAVLARFLGIECALPDLVPHYLTGLKKVFPDLSKNDLWYFHVHSELDPTHQAELLEVIGHYIHSEADVKILQDNFHMIYKQMTAMFDYEFENIDKESLQLVA